MKIVLFYHSLISDWNHGNAHFLRGVTSELIRRNFEVTVFEPEHGWSYSNLMKDQGKEALLHFKKAFPALETNFYPVTRNDWRILKDADLVIVHEWNDKALVKKMGQLKQQYGFTLLFHDTHHRSITAADQMEEYDLSHYDGVLAFGKVIRDIYRKNGWAKNAWVWHEAADARFFRPLQQDKKAGDVIWIGNWGDDERTEELYEFLIGPVKALGLKAKMYGVRYPDAALKLLKDAGITYGGYLPAHKVPEEFSKYSMTLHIPRRPYTTALPGIPTIRPFEALACGIPLLSAPWADSENLFTEGKDYLTAKDGEEMKRQMKFILDHPEKARELSTHGLQTVLSRHTCAHRVDELLALYSTILSNTKIEA